jgi:hypothetical protein
VFLVRTAKDKDVVKVGEAKTQLRILSMKLWKFWEALRRSKDIKVNWKRQKVVVIAVFWMSSGWTGIWW